MTIKEKINAVKALFSSDATIETPVNTVEVKFVDVKTEEGRILRVSDIAVEGTVAEITEEGEVAIEDGTYVLENGTSIVVVGSIITEVIEKEADEEIVDEEMSKVIDQAIAKFSEVLKEVSDMKAKFSALEADKVKLEAELVTVKANFSAVEDANKKLTERVDKFAKAPSAAPTITSVVETSVSLREKVLNNRKK